MKRLITIAFVAAIFATGAAAGSVFDSFKGKFASDRRVTATISKGDVLVEGTRYRINFAQISIVSNGSTVWVMDRDARECVIEKAVPVSDLTGTFVCKGEKRFSFEGKECVRAELAMVTGSDSKASGSGKGGQIFLILDPATANPIAVEFGGKTVKFKSFSSVRTSPLPEGEFTVDTGALGSDWIITDLR